MIRFCGIILLLILPVLMFAQTSCYNETRNRGISLFNKGQYNNARKAFIAAGSCPDKPSTNDLVTWIAKCYSAISESNRKEEERNSRICIYDGGYFIRDGKQWYEYRPKDKPNTTWATYSQTKEDENYYFIKSSVNDVCVPKSSVNKVYMAKNDKWEVVYNTTQVFNFCPQRGTKLFCHTTGFFFKDGDNWTEYRPEENSKSQWNTYVQSSLDSDFYYLKNSQCELAVPRKSSNKFFIKMPSDSKWIVAYTTTQVFDY